MTRSLPDPSLAPFDPEIERTLTHIRQARCRLAFVHSESGSLEGQADSPSPSNRDLHSSLNEGTLYSSVGSAEISLSELGDNTMAEPPRRITLKEAGAPDITLQPVQVRYPNLDAYFELETGMINLLPKYNGLPGEDPLKHLKDFQVVCSTARRHGSDEIAVMEFLEMFYPPQNTDPLRKEISSIMQRDGETLYEYWERFKKLLEACSHHCIDELVLICYFCQGMIPQDKLLLDASSGGSFTKNKTAEEA
ncbi:hypothetical protein AHAS_Ahas19G0177700 [Arachis hypogaea]